MPEKEFLQGLKVRTMDPSLKDQYGQEQGLFACPYISVLMANTKTIMDYNDCKKQLKVFDQITEKKCPNKLFTRQYAASNKVNG